VLLTAGSIKSADANSAIIATTTALFHNNFIQDRYIRECRIMNIHGNNRIDYACLMACYFPVYFPEKVSRCGSNPGSVSLISIRMLVIE
jgi:hypothetical protein